jgi:hypothetical protein
MRVDQPSEGALVAGADGGKENSFLRRGNCHAWTVAPFPTARQGWRTETPAR